MVALWRVRKTIHAMLDERKYLLTQDDLNMTKEEFKMTFGENPPSVTRTRAPPSLHRLRRRRHNAAALPPAFAVWSTGPNITRLRLLSLACSSFWFVLLLCAHVFCAPSCARVFSLCPRAQSRSSHRAGLEEGQPRRTNLRLLGRGREARCGSSEEVSHCSAARLNSGGQLQRLFQKAGN